MTVSNEYDCECVIVCCDCPLCYDMCQCGHPGDQEERSLSYQTSWSLPPPDWCPLRKKPLLIVVGK